ncbi:MAG: response regulator transcription factor [Segetibacter sp.]|nr:response regulator transcription factor [Segetibacter sp.]
MTQLVIIDDHPLVTDGIATMLKDVSWLQIIGSYKTGSSAIQFLENNFPDVILLDINLPDIDGLQLCSLIRSKNRTMKIIGLTSINEAGIITQFLKRGGNGYLLKNMERDELLLAIEKVQDGFIYLSKEANEKILQQFLNVKEATNNTPTLTRREKEVLQLLNEGYNGPRIAEKLFLSQYTVETHRRNLMQKFNVHNIQSLLHEAYNMKLI